MRLLFSKPINRTKPRWIEESITLQRDTADLTRGIINNMVLTGRARILGETDQDGRKRINFERRPSLKRIKF